MGNITGVARLSLVRDEPLEIRNFPLLWRTEAT